MKNNAALCHQIEIGPGGRDAETQTPVLRKAKKYNCDVEGAPSVECRVSGTLSAVAQAIGGQVVAGPTAGLTARPTIHLPRAELLLVGTALSPPFHPEEARELADITGDSVAIIRVEQDNHADRPFTIDILMAHAERWVSRYIPWQIHTSSELWFVPSQGEGRSFRVLPIGLLASPRAPFSSVYEREYGFGLAMRSITDLMGAR
jgi:hypothetical protein